jgi:scyllo-inositol 2-dehydrogenase (NAD+)
VIRVALLSRWHVHADEYARFAAQHPDLSIVRVWDEVPERGQQWAEQLEVPFESDLDAVLAAGDVDAVIVDTPTNLHKDVIVRAARHGKHIFTEKVLAFTVRDCQEIFHAVDDAGVRLMLSLPRLSERYFLYAERALAEGRLGRLNTVRCRLAHNGAVPGAGGPQGWLPPHFFDPDACGGGALIDLGAHPIYLCNRLAGRVRAVTARLSSLFQLPVDDTSAAIVEYESGALGIVETGFSSGRSPFLLELHGTDGSLLIEDGKVRLQSGQVGGGEWVVVEPEDLPTALPSPLQQWVDWIQRGISPQITRQDMLDLTLVNEAAAQSNRTGRRVAVEEIGGEDIYE